MNNKLHINFKKTLVASAVLVALSGVSGHATAATEFTMRGGKVTLPLDISSGSGDSNGNVVIGPHSKDKGRANPSAGKEGVAIGVSATAGVQGVAVGANVQSAEQSVAVGNDVHAKGRSSIAIGGDDITSYDQNVTTYDNTTYFKPASITISDTRYSPTTANGEGAIAVGFRSLAYAKGSTAVGTLSFALKDGATALGTQTRAEGVQAIALGSHSNVFANHSIGAGNNIQILEEGGTGLGYKAYSGGQGSIAIGTDVYANTKLNLAAQSTFDVKACTSTEAAKETGFDKLKDGKATVTIHDRLKEDINGAARHASDNTLLDNGNFFTNSQAGSAGGYIDTLEMLISDVNSTLATTRELNGVKGIVETQGKNEIVIGTKSAALGNNSFVVGRGSFATHDNGFAIGSYSYSDADNALAIGLASKALANNAVAMGVGTGVSGKASTAIGTGSAVTGANSSLLGSGSRLFADQSVLVGSNSFVFSDQQKQATPTHTIGNEAKGTTIRNIVVGDSVVIAGGVRNSTAIGARSYWR